MSEGYTPTESDLRQAYVEASGASMAQESYYAEQVAEFERGIARIKADAREALLSDESVERAAHGIHASHDRGWHFDAEDHAVQDEYRDMARVALSAALGENENDE